MLCFKMTSCSTCLQTGAGRIQSLTTVVLTGLARENFDDVLTSCDGRDFCITRNLSSCLAKCNFDVAVRMLSLRMFVFSAESLESITEADFLSYFNAS